MKGNKTLLLTVMLFYMVAGAAACMVFFTYGTFWDREEKPAVVSYYEQETRAVLAETTIAETEAVLAESVAEPESQTVPETAETPAEEESSEALAPPETEPTPYYSFRVMNIQGRLHVREGAGSSYAVVASLNPGSSGFVLEKGPQWSLIQTENVKGYVYNKYVEFEEIPQEEYLPLK